MTAAIKNSPFVPVLIALALGLGSCGVADQDPLDGIDDRLSATHTIPTPDALRLIAFVNDPTTDLVLLDDEVRLNSLAASCIIDHRNGRDGWYPSDDDDPFGDLEELDQVMYVGPRAIARLRDHAQRWRRPTEPVDDGRVLAGRFDGVLFDEVTARVALQIANVASLEQLTVEGGLWAAGAERIVDHRPYRDLDEVAGLGGVGTQTMTALESYAASGRWNLER